MNFIIYGVIALAILAGIAGFVHTEREAGRDEVRAQWAAQNAKDAETSAARIAAARATAAKAAEALAKAQQSATTYEAEWRSERDKHSNESLAGCTTTAPIPGDTKPSPPAVRFSAGFLHLWDGAWTDSEGQSIFSDLSPFAGDTTYSADALTAIGPGEVLDNFQANAALCSADRRKLNALIGQIEALRAGWH